MAKLPTKQTAIVGLPDGSLGIVHDAPVPTLQDDMVLVRNAAAGLNPVDSKMVGSLATPGALAGMDFAGHVVAIGSGARTATPLKVGDRVCGSVQGMHSLTPTIGAFSQYVGACDLITIKLSDTMSFEEGASFGVGIGTSILALFRSLALPGSPKDPAEVPKKVLVYGGSTATGTLAIQLLKLSGHIPIATCSPHNFDMVRSYGAEAVFDYHLPTVINDIKRYTGNSLKYVMDCISEPETMKFCYACIGRAGGSYTALEPYPEGLHTRSTVRPDWVLGPAVLGPAVLGPAVLGKTCRWPAPFELEENASIKEWTREWFGIIQQLVTDGRLRSHPLRIMPQGMDDIIKGLEMLRKKLVSGEKLVCRIEESSQKSRYG